MKSIAVLALIFGVDAINIKQKGPTNAPLPNTCVNVRKDSGIEEPCDTPGNSAWIPDEPLPSPEDLGLTAGWDGDYYFFSHGTNGDGYDKWVNAPGRKPDYQGIA